jgi:hypothetical protein
MGVPLIVPARFAERLTEQLVLAALESVAAVTAEATKRL